MATCTGNRLSTRQSLVVKEQPAKLNLMLRHGVINWDRGSGNPGGRRQVYCSALTDNTAARIGNDSKTNLTSRVANREAPRRLNRRSVRLMSGVQLPRRRIPLSPQGRYLGGFAAANPE